MNLLIFLSKIEDDDSEEDEDASESEESDEEGNPDEEDLGALGFTVWKD